MKKISLILCMAVVLSAMVLSTAYASTWTSDQITCGTGSNTLVISLSKNVYFSYAYATGMYVAGAYHYAGNRTLGSSSMDTKLYYKDTTAQDLPATVDASTGIGPTWSASGFQPM